jgi:DNA repair exonuclease SbcCD ATPase subunit
MKITDILNEASDDSGDYQQMLAFTRANRVGGVPDEQQIPLALFKELKKQQQQNQALGAELDAAEQRIDQATQSGELSQKELGMHRTELDRERAAGDQQKAAVTQLGQQYSEREKASGEQIQQLSSQLQQVRNMPGVNKSAAEALEKQIKELGERSVPIDRLAELESSIAQIQNSSIADDSAIQDLVSQVKAAQETTKEIEKTKQSIKQDADQAAQGALDAVAQMKQDIQRLQQVEKEVKELEPKVDSLTQDKIIRDKIALKRTGLAAYKALATGALPSGTPMPTGSVSDPQIQPPVAESAFARSIAWATGKPL